VKQRLNIVPFTLAQFQKYFELMFTSGDAKPEKLVELIDRCTRKRDMMEAPACKEYIEDAVNAEESSYAFPHGIYFGSRIRNKTTGRIGTVLGLEGKSIIIAFENDMEPIIEKVGIEFFEERFRALA
jgi:hypothetical protein